MVIPDTLLEPINALQQNMFINAPTISQTAALKCWEGETIEELEKHVTKYKTSRSILLEALSKYDTLTMAPADGGFYIYVDLGPNLCLPLGLGSDALCKMFLEEHHVAFTPGIDFEGEAGQRRFRISYAGGIETSRIAMERFAEFWPTWLDRVGTAKEG